MFVFDVFNERTGRVSVPGIPPWFELEEAQLRGLCFGSAIRLAQIATYWFERSQPITCCKWLARTQHLLLTGIPGFLDLIATPIPMEKRTVQSAAPMTPMRRLWCKFQSLRPPLPLIQERRAKGMLQAVEQSNGVAAAPEFPTSSLIHAATAIGPSSQKLIVTEEEEDGRSGLDALQLSTPVKQQARSEPAERARVAIQQSDSPFDAVVVTTLPSCPFRYHDDLAKMSRPELVAAANLFNAHLPGALQIDASLSASDARIRRAIERLVGIVPNTPGAPKAIRKTHRANNQSYQTKNLSPPSSPLATRVSRRRGPAKTTCPSLVPLERLDEVKESNFSTNQRPLKRRKVSNILATPTYFEGQSVINSDWASDS